MVSSITLNFVAYLFVSICLMRATRVWLSALLKPLLLRINLFRHQSRTWRMASKGKSLRSDLRLKFDQKHPYASHSSWCIVGYVHHSAPCAGLGLCIVEAEYFLLIPMWIPRDPEPDTVDIWFHPSCTFYFTLGINHYLNLESIHIAFSSMKSKWEYEAINNLIHLKLMHLFLYPLPSRLVLSWPSSINSDT